MRVLLLLCLALPAFGASVHQHIIGGTETTIDQYPHMLSVRDNGNYQCGASLIGETRAVTAAHCVGAAIGSYRIYGGATDRTVTDCSNCANRDLNLLSRHPNWDETALGWPNDIAVLGFIAFTFNIDLQPIVLAAPGDGLFAGEICTVAGWGDISPTAPQPANLQSAEMTVLVNFNCDDTWGGLIINDGHVCAYDSRISLCNGDGGGPLECSNKLVGTGSWFDSNCDGNYPSVFSRISYFYDWIILQ